MPEATIQQAGGADGAESSSAPLPWTSGSSPDLLLHGMQRVAFNETEIWEMVAVRILWIIVMIAVIYEVRAVTEQRQQARRAEVVAYLLSVPFDWHEDRVRSFDVREFIQYGRPGDWSLSTLFGRATHRMRRAWFEEESYNRIQWEQDSIRRALQ